jgi:hypothetical protein
VVSNKSKSLNRGRFWTPEDLANYLGVPVGWIYKRTRKNGPELIPHIKLGKYVRFDPESKPLRVWLADHEMNPSLLETCDASALPESLTTGSPLHTFGAREKTGQIN